MTEQMEDTQLIESKEWTDGRADGRAVGPSARPSVRPSNRQKNASGKEEKDEEENHPKAPSASQDNNPLLSTKDITEPYESAQANLARLH